MMVLAFLPTKTDDLFSHRPISYTVLSAFPADADQLISYPVFLHIHSGVTPFDGVTRVVPPSDATESTILSFVKIGSGVSAS